MLIVLIIAIVVNILTMVLVMTGLADIRVRVIHVGMAMIMVSNILQQIEDAQSNPPEKIK